jgi:methylaspartate ammonia-lyase
LQRNRPERAPRLAVHIAIATGSDQILARPGMGVDEGVCIMRNEMARLRQLLG